MLPSSGRSDARPSRAKPQTKDPASSLSTLVQANSSKSYTSSFVGAFLDLHAVHLKVESACGRRATGGATRASCEPIRHRHVREGVDVSEAPEGLSLDESLELPHPRSRVSTRAARLTLTLCQCLAASSDKRCATPHHSSRETICGDRKTGGRDPRRSCTVVRTDERSGVRMCGCSAPEIATMVSN